MSENKTKTRKVVLMYSLRKTGDKDRNGRDIYAGDVLRPSQNETDQKCLFYVVEDRGKGFSYRDNFNHNVPSFDKPRDMEVVGNVFDNLDLWLSFQGGVPHGVTFWHVKEEFNFIVEPDVSVEPVEDLKRN